MILYDFITFLIIREILIKSARADRKRFSSDKRMENSGILYVFPVFHSAWMGKKISFPAADDLFRGSLAKQGKVYRVNSGMSSA